MKLSELKESTPNAITVYVDQEFSDAALEFDIHDKDYEDISLVEEPLTPIALVITPIENDYRGVSGHSDWYENEPELAYYQGTKTGNVYQQDLLNDPQNVVVLRMPATKFMKFLNDHILEKRAPGEQMH